MRNLNYAIYLVNPEIRDDIDQEARRARAEAFGRCIITPLINVFANLFRRAESPSATDSSFPYTEPDVRSGV